MELSEFEKLLIQYGLKMMEIGQQETLNKPTGRLRNQMMKMKMEIMREHQAALDLCEYLRDCLPE